LQADAGFKERRKIVAHQKLVDKLNAVQSPNGPLNYADRIGAVEDRAAYDLREAYQRLRVLRSGLSTIYGLDAVALPPPPAIGGEVAVDFLDGIVEWVRRVAVQLQDIYNNDQDVIFPFSLSTHIGREQFHEGLKSGSWEFEIGRSHFHGYRLVRLRGMTAIAHASDDRFYSLMARAPRDSIVVHKTDEASVVQHVDECWLGQVLPRCAQHRPDVVGTRVLWNASPFGRWRLRAAPGTDLAHLKDLHITLNVSAQVV